MIRTAIATFASLAFVAASVAQTPPKPAPFTYLPAAEQQKLVANPDPKGGAKSSMLDRRESFSAQIVSRAADGTVEAHAHWIDYITILEGEVTLTVGGTISGNTVDDLGESHGGAQAGGTALPLRAGDYIQIQAGVPHRMTAPKGLRYMAMKVRN